MNLLVQYMLIYLDLIHFLCEMLIITLNSYINAISNI